MLGQENFAFDCYSSSWVDKNSSELGENKNIRSLGTNKECRLKPDAIKWPASDQVVNATFRCEKGSLTGEYTVSVFKEKSTPYGDYFCNSAHFSADKSFPFGSITDTLDSPY